jgi:hypothetical protein
MVDPEPSIIDQSELKWGVVPGAESYLIQEQTLYEGRLRWTTATRVMAEEWRLEYSYDLSIVSDGDHNYRITAEKEGESNYSSTSVSFSKLANPVIVGNENEVARWSIDESAYDSRFEFGLLLKTNNGYTNDYYLSNSQYHSISGNYLEINEEPYRGEADLSAIVSWLQQIIGNTANPELRDVILTASGIIADSFSFDVYIVYQPKITTAGSFVRGTSLNFKMIKA